VRRHDANPPAARAFRFGEFFSRAFVPEIFCAKFAKETMVARRNHLAMHSLAPSEPAFTSEPGGARRDARSAPERTAVRCRGCVDAIAARLDRSLQQLANTDASHGAIAESVEMQITRMQRGASVAAGVQSSAVDGGAPGSRSGSTAVAPLSGCALETRQPQVLTGRQTTIAGGGRQ
jgi:hypothetical protein